MQDGGRDARPCGRGRLEAEGQGPDVQSAVQSGGLSGNLSRHIVEYHRKEAPGTVVVDSDNKFLYYVLPDGKAIRYGIAVGEEAQAWSGIAKVGRMEEWPPWIPTPGEQTRLGPLPAYVTGGPHNPMGARGMYLYSGNKDTLYRIHGTNQPEYIGSAVSSGCIRMTNEDAIDLYNHVKVGTPGDRAGAASGRCAVQPAHGGIGPALSSN